MSENAFNNRHASFAMEIASFLVCFTYCVQAGVEAGSLKYPHKSTWVWLSRPQTMPLSIPCNSTFPPRRLNPASLVQTPKVPSVI